MYLKISSMLDTIANSLESKGLIKEAYEIDKIADAIDNIEAGRIPAGIGGTAYGRALDPFVRSQGPRPIDLDAIVHKFNEITDSMIGHGISQEKADE